MDINTGKQLLVDDRIIEDIWNVRRETVRPAKFIDNPLMVADRPWEDKGVASCYVLFDEQENIFKIWYNVFNYVTWRNEEDHCYTYWICYAESKNGLHWDKPELGIIEYEGSTKNNLVMQGEWWATLGTVLKEMDEEDPARRYKMLYTDVFDMPTREAVAQAGGIDGEWSGRSGVCMAYSADGIHWEPYAGNPVIDGESDTTNSVFWDKDIGKYAYFMRPRVYAGHWKRRIARSESCDLHEWSDPQMVLVPDELDPVELYGMPVFKYEGYYFGLLQMYYSESKATIEIQLAFSRDGIKWDRLPTRDLFLGLGMQHGQGADFDSGMIIVNRPVVVGDELWFYYTGYKAVHTDFSNTFALGLAVSKLDRLIGRATPEGEGGLLLTRPLSWQGDAVEVNVSSADGAIQVEVLSEQGEIVAGYERTSSMVFSGDSLRQQMQWKDGRTMGALNGRRVRLKFYLSNATLYSFAIKNCA
tara:strand:- start:1348 stop:2763 length:1416 start_codon:yes stop_codon:yes gene_type:complete